MAVAKRIILNGVTNTAKDYIPYDPSTNVEYYAYINGTKIPHWTAKTYPASAMTANTSQSCTVTTAGNYSTSATYAPWKAFDSDSNSTAWASAQDISTTWIMLKVPSAMKNIAVSITNRDPGESTYVNGPENFKIQGSDDGSSFTDLLTVTGRDGSTAKKTTTHTCTGETAYNNAFQYIRIYITQWYNDKDYYGKTSSNYCAIANIKITGKIAT